MAAISAAYRRYCLDHRIGGSDSARESAMNCYFRLQLVIWRIEQLRRSPVLVAAANRRFAFRTNGRRRNGRCAAAVVFLFASDQMLRLCTRSGGFQPARRELTETSAIRGGCVRARESAVSHRRIMGAELFRALAGPGDLDDRARMRLRSPPRRSGLLARCEGGPGLPPRGVCCGAPVSIRYDIGENCFLN